jgi:uncharacterized membrane protein (DUF485 family)
VSENDKRGLAGWLGLHEPFDYSKARWLGPVLSGLVFLLFILAIASAGKMLGVAVFGDASLTPGNSLGIGAVTVALIGAPFVIWRSVVAQKSVDVQEQGQITDRINKAVEGLGAEKTTSRIGRPVSVNLSESAAKLMEIGGGKSQVTRIEWQGQDPPYRFIEESIADEGEWQVFSETEPNLEVRIGAIYALERISQDSARDHIQIMEILCAYIRQNAGRGDVPLPEGEPTPEEWRVWAREGQEHPRLDVDVALKVIERRGDKRKQLEKDQHPPYGIGLERALLRKIILSDRDLSQGEFREAELQGANLWSTQLQGANLFGAQLQGANLRNATLKGASLNYARFEGADLRETTFTGDLGLTTAYFQGAAIGSIDLSSIPEISAHLPGMFADGTVTLPGGHRTEHESWPQHWPKFELDYQQFEIEWRKWQKEGPDYKPPKAE